MSNVERTTSWQQIQLGVKEAERLIVRKEYNLVMVKARQVLEYMVRCMAERACLVEGDLSDTIDQLYEVVNGFISQFVTQVTIIPFGRLPTFLTL